MKRLFLSLALALGIFAIPLPSFATVSSTTNTVQYSGDGHSTSFSFNNNVYLASDLNVYEVTAGVSTLLTLNTNYLVSLTAISGVTGAYTATINLAGGSSPAGALAVGTTLVITRNIPYTQLINISDYSATPAATWNQAHDRGVILSQQLLNLVNRSILQSITATTPIVFPSSSPGLLLGWNNSGLLDNIANTSNPWLYSGSNIYYNNGNVGIGTTAPGTKLSVSGGGAIGSSYATTAVSDGNLIISGNVGIGTASPLTSFDIKPLANQHLLVFSNGVGNGIGMSAVVDANNADVPLAIDALSLILNPNSNGNVGIGTRSPAGILDVTSTTSAFLPPRMTTTQKNAISPVVDGMVVYDTTLHGLYVYSTGTSTWQTMGSQTALPYIKVSETETSGINGGNATTGNWTARVLNTKDSDTSSIASLCTSNGVPVATCTAANQVVLPAGTYLVKVTSPFCRTSLTQIRLYNVTGAASVLLGESTYGVAGYTCMSDSLRGVFTLSTPSALSVQYQVSVSTANNDLGQPDSFGTEVYTVVDFSKTG